MGAGDDVPKGLEQMGYEVKLLDIENIASVDLNQFQAVICGIRAYNTKKSLAQYKAQFMDYVNDGGNFIVQYNTNRNLDTDAFAPFPLQLSRDRVTDEKAKATFIDADESLLNQPNQN